ncbi:Hypothetical predicted protein [Pelobates cultripes]|uniref:Uncharacterized protein n=1 Tax=Pelobates cultripes TaxID=61616 RepID=A0AAD1SFD2_PELCU|nr:Hypothetical predicted protein [Pelobates cultripes]
MADSLTCYSQAQTLKADWCPRGTLWQRLTLSLKLSGRNWRKKQQITNGTPQQKTRGRHPKMAAEHIKTFKGLQHPPLAAATSLNRELPREQFAGSDQAEGTCHQRLQAAIWGDQC